MMDTLICDTCGGRGDTLFQESDKSSVEIRPCSSCHGSGQDALYRTRILKRPAGGGKSIAMDIAVKAMSRFLKKEK